MINILRQRFTDLFISNIRRDENIFKNKVNKYNLKNKEKILR